MTQLPKVVAVIGPTGVGKSKIGLELCKKFNGEVVNTDAMQMYKGLDLATAKVTPAEQKEVVHHLLGVLDPADSCTVHGYRDMAIAKIQDIISRDKVPVLVGGTLYYVQSLLWPSLIDEESNDNADAKQRSNSPSPKERQEKVEQIGSHQLYSKLKEVDPEMAAQWHPNDTRKIERSLQVFYDTGIPHSELIRRQEEKGAPEKLRWDCRVLWLTCETEEHNQRLGSRVDEMIAQGLVEEARSFLRKHTNILDELEKNNVNAEYTSDDLVTSSGTKQKTSNFSAGNLQAIGYREFIPYFQAEYRKGCDTTQVLKECVENLKIKHRQYARKQMRWVKNRMLSRNAPIVELDTTGCASNAEQWDIKVLKPAYEIIDDLLHSSPQGDSLTGSSSVEATDHTNESSSSSLPVFPNTPALRAAGITMYSNKPFNKQAREDRLNALRQQFVCDSCNGKVIQGSANWRVHLKSSGHRRILKRKAKQELRMVRKADKARKVVETNKTTTIQDHSS